MIETLMTVINTMETIPIAGIENQRRFTGCAMALKALVDILRQTPENPEQKAADGPTEEKTEVADG